ncbi:MAG: tetratricopeptide repeat protein [Rubinisphaera brasiliensis]|uniref:tetratricopeptide repeat protein n=1 Tax=Rubinisphaera brasiliensis TaxID=119 RepID=UPI00391B350F
MSQHYQRAELLYEQSRLKEALEELQYHLRDFPDDVDAFTLQAHALARLERFDAAMDAVAAAFEIAPDYGCVYRASAFVQYRSNRLKEAHVAIKEAIRLDPNNFDFHRLQAIFWLHQDEYQKMFESANRALELNPDDELSLNLQSMALRALGRPLEAEQVALLSLHRNPEIAFSHANRGWGLLERKDYAGAKKHFREALRLNPNYEWARDGLMAATKATHRGYQWTYGLLQRLMETDAAGFILLIAVVLGFFFGMLLVHGRETPGPIEFFTGPLVLTILCFAFLISMDNPFYYTLLRLSRDGRLLLDRRQRMRTRGLICCATASLTFAVLYVLSDNKYMIDGMVWSLLLAIPATLIHTVRRGLPRFTMAVFTAVLTAALAIHIVEQTLALQEGTASESFSSSYASNAEREISFDEMLLRFLRYGCLASLFAPFFWPAGDEQDEADIKLS